MSLLLTGSVALGYAAGVIGLHRLNVHRLRRRADGYAPLSRLDWDSLLAGLGAETPRCAGLSVRPRDGGPPPKLLQRGLARSDAEQQVLAAIVAGHEVSFERITAAGFSASDARWLGQLARLASAPQVVLEELELSASTSAPEIALKEWLTLHYGVTPWSLEWTVFAVKRRLAQALERFGDVPQLYFVRALASGALGFTAAVLDDVARAVYFSREAEFYTRAVVDMHFIEEERPSLFKACSQRLALEGK